MIATPTPTRDSALRIRPTAARFTRVPSTPAITPALGTRLAVVALLRRQKPGDGGDFLAAGLPLRHFDVAFVEAELFAVDVGAEEQVADEQEEDTGDDARDDGGDVGSGGAGVGVGSASISVRAASAAGCFGGGGAVRSHGVCYGFACCERAVCGCYDGGCDCCAAVAVSADDFDDGVGDLVAVGALQTSKVGTLLYLRGLLIEGVVSASRVEVVVSRVVAVAVVVGVGGASRRKRSVLLYPFQVAQVEDVDSWTFTAELVANVTANHDELAIPYVAGMTTATIRHGLAIHIHLNPGEGRYRKNPHVVVLRLFSRRYEVLSAEHVDIV